MKPKIFAIACAMVLGLGVPLVASAQLPPGGVQGINLGIAVGEKVAGLMSIGSIASSVFSGAMFVISWLLVMIASAVIAIQAWGLNVILNISFGLVNSAPVKWGFPVMLAIANLAFVAGIIIIAIATILRQDRYGVKKVLWKLVVMAILINFGLVICGAMLKVSDDLTKYFIAASVPGSGDSGVGYFHFASAIAGAFNPAGVFVNPTDFAKHNPAVLKTELSGFSLAGDSLGNMLKPLVGVLSTLGALTIMIITLGTLVVALVYRYVKMGMLLILLPLAWAAFAFPSFEQHYKTWWKDFTKWLVFPPVVVFFLWVGLKVSEAMALAEGEFKPLYESSSGLGATQALANLLGNLVTPVIAQTLKTFILFGIMMGGLVAANKLGVEVAGAGVKILDNGGKWLKGKAGHYTRRGVRAAYQQGVPFTGGRFGGRRLEEALIKNKIPLIGSPLANLGRTIKSFSQLGGEAIVEGEVKSMEIPDNDTDIAKMLESEKMRFTQVLAALSKVKDIGKVKNIGDLSLAEWLDKYHQKTKDYNQKDLERKLRDTGATHEVASAVLGRGELSLDEAVNKAMKEGDHKAIAKLLKNNALGLRPEEAKKLYQSIVRNLGVFSATQTAEFTSGFDKAQVDNFKQAFQNVFAGKSEADLNKEISQGGIGADNVKLFKTNGAIISRNMGAKALWGGQEKVVTEQSAGEEGIRVTTTRPDTYTTTTSQPTAGPSSSSGAASPPGGGGPKP